MQKFDFECLGWTNTCCICGKNVISFNNPEPLRDGNENCCNMCNRLVIAARKKIWSMPKHEQEAYIRMIRDIPYKSLEEILYLS